MALPAERTILTIHDLGFLNSYSGIKRFIIKKLFLDFPVRKVKCITTVSQKSKEEILNNTKCSPDKIVVIPNPVFNFNRSPITLNLNPKPVILFIGATTNKNLENSIPALFDLPIQLRIIGEVPEKQILRLIKFNISYTNVCNLSEYEMFQEYINSDILLFPSTYEGFGLPIIEAFQAGCSVITSDLPPMSDVAGDAALLVNPNSIISIRKAIVSLIHDKQLRNLLVVKGYARIGAYQNQVIAFKYDELYQMFFGNIC